MGGDISMTSETGRLAPSRNTKGQYEKGSSGNPRGRPRRKWDPYKSLGEYLHEALQGEVVVTDGRGKRRRMPAKQAVATRLVESLLTASGKDFLSALDKAGKLSAAAERNAAESPADVPIDVARERLKARVEQIKEAQSCRGAEDNKDE